MHLKEIDSRSNNPSPRGQGGQGTEGSSSLGSQWAGDSGALQAAVPPGVLMEVLLVVVLCVVEGLGLRDLCGDLTQTFFFKYLRKEHGEHHRVTTH